MVAKKDVEFVVKKDGNKTLERDSEALPVGVQILRETRPGLSRTRRPARYSNQAPHGQGNMQLPQLQCR